MKSIEKAKAAAERIDQYTKNVMVPVKKLEELLHWATSQVCQHEETHRGGVLWEICDHCGAKWADDEGGKPELKWPAIVDEMYSLIAAAPKADQAQELHVELPPLPVDMKATYWSAEYGTEPIGYTSDQMREYALQAIAALAQKPEASTAQDEREAFESYMKTDHSYPELRKNSDGSYTSSIVNRHWHTWQARSALAQKEDKAEQHEPLKPAGDADKAVYQSIADNYKAEQQAEPIGEMRESGVVWFKQNPHAYPVGTKFYAHPPAQQQLSDNLRDAVANLLKVKGRYHTE